MKKLLLRVWIALIMIPLGVMAQPGTVVSGWRAAAQERGLPGYADSLAGGAALDRNAVPGRALRHFRQHFAGVEDEQWGRTPAGFMTHFFSKGAVSRAFYDKKGNCVCSIRCYGAADLPEDVRAIVRAAWVDYTILTVEEIRVADAVIYQTDLRKDKHWVTIRVQDGEWELVHAYENL